MLITVLLVPGFNRDCCLTLVFSTTVSRYHRVLILLIPNIESVSLARVIPSSAHPSHFPVFLCVKSTPLGIPSERNMFDIKVTQLDYRKADIHL